MATKRKPIASHSAKLNYRLTDMKPETKGTKPTTEPTSILEILTLMVLYVCKKCILYNTNHKVCIYLGALFLVSLMVDFASVPKSLFSKSDNILNQYFVKYAWGWNLILVVPYVLLTSFIYCCGQQEKIIKHHISRICIATFFWWAWTNFFNYIETGYGKCFDGKFSSKQTCLKSGNLWNGFDISGHSFILVYGSLMLIEEARSLVNWDSIKDHMRLEEHYRVTNDKSHSTNPLKNLTKEEFAILQSNYDKYTPYIRGLFIAITLLNILWDFMLFWTICYYHVMVEKFLGGSFAILTWFITYKIWYPSNYLPKLPGDGIFKYIKPKPMQITPINLKRRTGGNSNQSIFLGRQLNTVRSESVNNSDDQQR